MSEIKPPSQAPSNGFAEAFAIICIFATIVLCIGDPDLLDAVIASLMRA